MKDTNNKITRYIKGNSDAFLTTKSNAYEITFTMPDGIKYTSEFPFEDYGSKSKALNAAKYELASYGYTKARKQDQPKAEEVRSEENTLVARYELDENLFALESILHVLYDTFVLPEDVAEKLLALQILASSKLGMEESYSFDVRSKLFLEIHRD